MRILGVDPALRITGYGIVDKKDSFLELAGCGIIATSPRDKMQDRLAMIHADLSQVIREFSPDTMAIEKIFVHYEHTTTAFLLGQARGAIILAAAQNGLPVVEYAATQVKKAVVGRGHATKTQIQRMVVSQLGMDRPPKHLDVTDALALALTHIYHNAASAADGSLTKRGR